MFGPLLLALLAILLCAAAWTDLRDRTIPNALNAAVALLAPCWWWASGLALWPGVPLQLGLVAAVFALFLGFFALGAMGGGDVKLIAAVALWLPLDLLLQMLILTAMAGGVVTLATLAVHRLRKAPGQPEIPYGVAIAFAGLWVSYERYLYHFG